MGRKIVYGILALAVFSVLVSGCNTNEPDPSVGQCWQDTYGNKCEVTILDFRDSADGHNDVIDFRWDSSCDHAGKSIGITEGNYPTGAWKERFNPCK